MKKIHLGTGGISCVCGIDAESVSITYEYGKCTCKNCLSISSKHDTQCAECHEYKHTPIRNDEMGGYVCISCVDKELSRLQSWTATLAREAGATSAARDMVISAAQKLLKELDDGTMRGVLIAEDDLKKVIEREKA